MKYLIIVVMLLGNMVVTSANAQQETTQQQQLQQIDSLLKENPEIIPSVLASLKSYVTNKATASERSKEHGAWLFDNDNAHPWFGAEKSELDVLVFTDYDCPFCKRLEPHLQKLLKNFPTLKVINVMVPLRQQNVSGGQLNPAAYAINVWQNQPAQPVPAPTSRDRARCG